MHIAFLTPEYPHAKTKHAGGLGTSIKNLVAALVKENVTVSIFIYGQNCSQQFSENGVHFHLIEDKKYPFLKWFWYRMYLQNYINKACKENKINVIEAPDWTGITAFMSFVVPLIIRFHGSDTYFCQLEKRKQKWKNRLFETLAARKAKICIAPTHFAGKESARLLGVPMHKVHTIHYGLDLEQFKNETPAVYENGLILYIGTIIRKKGVFELPAIFNSIRKNHPEAKLILIGNDSGDIQTNSASTWELLQKQFHIDDLINVSYLGKIPYLEVQTYIKKANVCIFPTYAETLGMVTIESMALQKPVVNSNIGWAKELMEDGKSGFLVYPSNHLEFADKISMLLRDNQKVMTMGAFARSYVEANFDIQNIAKKNITLYKNVISKR
ncbi:glycosyltransferase family 4 protein [Flavobacterium sp. J27]|uniref:glycosyltransferase family 4 protein n=1 Tax=Flavobacterium sp. J27 TaxID=2060419 RepID=UPI0010325590|nr:glycosyltransferase family 4 protein [Flavobacterium sp. J27]